MPDSDSCRVLRFFQGEFTRCADTGALSRSHAGRAKIAVPAFCTGFALSPLDTLHPDLWDRVFAESGKLHHLVRLFVNEEQLDSAALDKPLGVDDRVEILAAIAVGEPRLTSR